MTNDIFYHSSWPVFFEDNHLLTLYKPAGLLVQGDVTQELSLLDLAKVWLKERYNKPGRVFLGLVHRLDRTVAGVIVFARTSKAAARLSEQFRSGKARKRYLAVVEGKLEKGSERLVHRIERLEHYSRVILDNSPNAQDAALRYRLLDRTQSRSLLEIDLETGRRHQIRVQLSYIGHPIVGDVRYGASTPLPRRQIALLARELTIDHPTRGERLTFECPIPRGWPWPTEENASKVPPWNWDELRPAIKIPDLLLDPCAFRRSMKK